MVVHPYSSPYRFIFNKTYNLFPESLLSTRKREKERRLLLPRFRASVISPWKFNTVGKHGHFCELHGIISFRLNPLKALNPEP